MSTCSSSWLQSWISFSRVNTYSGFTREGSFGFTLP